MRLSASTVALVLTGTAHAWRAGLWGNGKSLQVHGSYWPICNDLNNPFSVGELTFDGSGSTGAAGSICVYSEYGCSGTLRGCIEDSLTGVPIDKPGNVKSYKIGF